MRKLVKWFGVEMERLFWIIMFGVISLTGTILWLNGSLMVEAYFIGQCILIGLGYIASILKKSKTDILNQNIKQLLMENKGSGAPVGLEPGFDQLNTLMKDAGPLLEQMAKNFQQSKHFRNRQNNNEQILND